MKNQSKKTPKPVRIQLSRRKGFRLPADTIVVARPSRWGNPFRAENASERPRMVERYRKWFGSAAAKSLRAEAISCLCGRNLACWCPLDGPCHGDVLLAYVNGSMER